jgi:ATP-binding cassette subfamily B protein
VVYWYGAALLQRGPGAGGLSKGDFFAFNLALTRTIWPVISLGFSISIVQRGRAAWTRLQDVLDAQPEVTGGTLRAPQTAPAGLSVESLTFKQGDRTILSDVSFTVPPGTSLAVVGRTGSGKSTLAMLLARLLPTPAGAVKIGGLDVCDLPLAALRGAIGYAQQDAFLFSTTVARNIGFTIDDPDAPAAQERIRTAAKDAHVLDEVLALPEQFDTVVGERGVQLSGGQKQRIALARALLWGPKVLVLDDPLSAVDAKTERAILEALERQSAERQLVLVTHRVAAASRCDQILVLERGRIIERGTHAELVAARGLYAAFAEEQQMATELEEIGHEAVSAAAGGAS